MAVLWTRLSTFARELNRCREVMYGQGSVKTSQAPQPISRP
ncbi:hypothetical protein FHX42_003858 [Saccharopolyspora lacisalsi]|uniref:Uncharacterized protein n=1 Tax=Halosaccharopolyspora lacisalsi TaxID=1000566 RepID=A0A839DWY5_9PSEU|nr:hypothetical protein [Halosaccharopolyspora lacisalsi]MBA8826482.1 hypothetical protein [Halosaccharopolyspora lacisalsi]